MVERDVKAVPYHVAATRPDKFAGVWMVAIRETETERDNSSSYKVSLLRFCGGAGVSHTTGHPCPRRFVCLLVQAAKSRFDENKNNKNNKQKQDKKQEQTQAQAQTHAHAHATPAPLPTPTLVCPLPQHPTPTALRPRPRALRPRALPTPMPTPTPLPTRTGPRPNPRASASARRRPKPRRRRTATSNKNKKKPDECVYIPCLPIRSGIQQANCTVPVPMPRVEIEG